jgi:N-acetylglucosamine-6-phosphate deacetylase
MSDGELCAWHYASGKPVRLRWREGKIVSVETAPVPPPPEVWVAPGLFDPQVNGFGGVDFQQDGLTEADLLAAVRQLRAAGCTRFLLTLITDEWTRLIARLRQLRALRQESAELRAAIAGWHVEGPFLSAQPGFHGAHNPALMLDPTLGHIRELREATGSDPLLLTLAPERKGAIEAIAHAVSLGIKISLGHTDASAQTLRQAVEAGATGFTHLGNACPRELDKHDNIIWRVLETPGLMVSLIADQIHVSPALFRLIHRVLGPGSVCHTTDAMSAAGAPPGRYKLGHLEIEVGPDQIVWQPGRSNLAGSALRPVDGVFRAARMLGRRWQEVWDWSSCTPASWMRLPTGLEPGQPADFCVLETSGDGKLVEVLVSGRARWAATVSERPQG